jgi:tight adherence protein C
MLVLFAIMIGAAILFLVWGITAPPAAARANLFAELDVPADDPPKGTLLPALGRFVARITPATLIKGMEARLSQAGHPHGLDVPRMLGVKLLCGLSFGVTLGLVNPMLGLVAGGVLFFGPDYWLATKKEQRQDLMRNDAADLIDQLTITVEAGMGFDAALMRVASSNSGPLAVELHHAVQDMRTGVPREQALRALVDRTQIPEVRQLVTALVQAQRHGTPLADTLRIQGAELRDKRTQRVEEKAAKLGTKMIFPIIICFVPIFLVIVLVPSLAHLDQVLPG